MRGQRSEVRDQSPEILVVGASVRAAVHSALRSGRTATAIDLFADRDLVQVAPVVPVRRWPLDLPEAARNAPPGPWMYTGSLENHPGIVARIAAERPLWGNPAPVLRRVRNPFRVYSVLVDAGLPALAVRPAADPPPPDGTWLRKPRRSAAGRRIVRWTAAAAASASQEPHYFQQYATGIAVAAVYVASSAGVDLLGISQQLTGVRALDAKEFAYCGSIGPLQLPDRVMGQIERTGVEIGGRFGLVGLFGIDFVLAGGVAWPVEVNPRYTASVEVLEHAAGVSLLELHCRACAGERDTPFVPDDAGGARTVTKAILYAPCDLCVPALAELESADPVAAMPAYADLPHDGAVIRHGRPVCTVLAAGSNRTDSLELLDARLARLRGVLGLQPAARLADARGLSSDDHEPGTSAT